MLGQGVIAIITPFNFPLAIGMFLNAAPSIVEGNTVVIKPSEDAPMSTQMAVEIYEEAGTPHGVINLVLASVILVTLWLGLMSIRRALLVVLMSDSILGKLLLNHGIKLLHAEQAANQLASCLMMSN